MGRLADRGVIVTGAAQGIGASFAVELARQGARVCVCDVQPPARTVDAIKRSGGQAIGKLCDVTDARAVQKVAEETAREFGGIHGLVNNAALFAALPKRRIEDIQSEEFDRVMSVNVRGSFECVKAVVPYMRQQKYGKIVNIASGTVFKGQVMMLSYVTSKGALVAMTRCIARELGGDGIRANCLAPGFTMSEGVKAQADWVVAGEATVASRCLRREQTPEDLTGALIYLLSAESDFMTGQTMVVDGGSVTH